MMGTRKKRGFEPVGYVVYPFGLVVMLINGVVFAGMNSTHSWGIVTPLIFGAYIFWVGFCLVMLARMARIKSESIGMLYGLLLVPWYLAGEVIGASMIEGVSVGGGFAARWSAGYELFGSGSFAIKGWLWAIAYGLRVLIMVFVFLAVMISEGGKAFCESCRSAAFRTRWKSVIGSFDLDDLNAVDGMVALMDLERGSGVASGASRAVRIKVKTCKCRRVGELVAEVYARDSEEAGKTLIDGVQVSQGDLLELYSWIERVDPDAELGATELDAIEGFGRGFVEVEHEVFDVALRPEGAEWKSFFRWEGAGMATDWGYDTEFTRAMRKRLIEGDYLVIPEALAMATDVNDIACIYEASADWDGSRGWMDHWCTTEPDNTQALTVRGINLIKRAWIQRGGGWEPKNVPKFWGLLKQAMVDLDRATEIDATNSTAHSWKIYAGKGLEHSKEDLRKHFDLATSGCPELLAAHSMYHDSITEKWGGSLEMCIEFGRERMAACPDGSPSIVAIAFAHYEGAMRWREQDKKEGFEKYLAQADVRADILRGNLKAFRDHRMSMVTPRVRAFFAYMLWQTGHLQEARAHMEVIGKSTPWDPFSPGALVLSKEAYRVARKACGL